MNNSDILIATSYFGSKRQHLRFILPLLPRTKVYVEPFGGSAAILLNRPRSKVEVYNDLLEDICALMRLLRDDLAGLQREVELTPYSRSEFGRCNTGPDDSEMDRARKLLVASYQGIYSKLTHKSAAANWGRQLRAYGSKDSRPIRIEPWLRLPIKHQAVHKRLQGVVIENRDALDLIREYDSPDTLFYLDPPYVLSTRVYKNAYYEELKDSDHGRLAELLADIEGMAAVSGYASPLYDELFPGWMRYDDNTKRISASNKLDSVRTESLWTNYEARP